MIYEKQLRIESGCHVESALICLRNYKKECQEAPRGLGRSGLVVYVMSDKTAYTVYQTKTAYIVRLG